MGNPQNGWFIREIPNMDDWGVPPMTQETPICLAETGKPKILISTL